MKPTVMKKYITFCLILFSCFSLKAIHYYGSEIICKQLNGLTYHLTFKFYGNLNSGWNYDNDISMTVSNNSTGSNFTIIATRINDKNLYEGITLLNYSAILTFPAPGTYTVYQGTCCWTNSSNLVNSSGQTYFNQCLITVDTITGNSSPEFLYDPIVLAPVNDTLFYNPLPYDEDGDDLLWSIDTPRTYINTELSGYSMPAGNSGLNFSINPKTGEITWKPSMIGQYITAIKVEEYRNGIKIGEIIRDMIFVAEPKGANITRANVDAGTWSTDIYNNYIFYLTYNLPFNLIFDTYDPDGNILSVEAKGYPFIKSNNPATFASNSGSGYALSTFSWTPTFDDVKTDPYLVVFRIYEEAITDSVLRDKTVQLIVGDFSMGNENNIEKSIANFYPNPSTGELFIKVNVEKSAELNVIFINQLGEKVKEFDQKINAGQNLIYFNDLKLPAGVYFLNLLVDKNESVIKKLIINY